MTQLLSSLTSVGVAALWLPAANTWTSEVHSFRNVSTLTVYASTRWIVPFP
jgi:hypothetical protein